jgi:hypothetical protein
MALKCVNMAGQRAVDDAGVRLPRTMPCAEDLVPMAHHEGGHHEARPRRWVEEADTLPAEAMTTAYVDGRALVIGASTDPNPVSLAPDAVSALGHLADANIDIVLLGVAASDDGAQPSLPVAARLPELPAGAVGWLIAGTAAACAQARASRGLRTILVGSVSPARGLAGRACDLEARDLTDAALTIIAAEAMDSMRRAAP